MTRRLIILEPSKVGNQHITLINPYLEAAISADVHRVEFWCAPSLWQNVSEDLKPRLVHRAVPVIDPSSRRFLAKIPLELGVSVWGLLALRPGDILIVTCLFSPALYFFSWFCRLFPRRAVYVVLHGELEALRDETISPSVTGYGFWIRLFWRHCLTWRKPGLVVIDRFIRDNLLALSRELEPGRIAVLTFPIKPSSDEKPARGSRGESAKPRVCFVGYRSRMKGFDLFRKLADHRSEFEWLAIGGGRIENLATGVVHQIDSLEEFRNAVNDCDIALFPYERGYDLSMSAAVIDALSGGVQVIASRRACFVALADEFGSDLVCCVDGESGFNLALDRQISTATTGRTIDFDAILARSRFSQANLNREMRELVHAGMRLGSR